MSISEQKAAQGLTFQNEESTYLQAISQALGEAMREDETVIQIGEDIGEFGGAFKVTKGLIEEFGEDRVIDTPLSESGFIGAAVGAALMGLRPVVEVQYADFLSCGWDQIVNVAAKIHYRTGDPVPMVIRAPSGAGLRAGPFHSQSPEGWFAHVPGLKVVCPATPFDAKGLLRSAIKDPNPVIFLEHKYLYRRLKERLPREKYEVDIGRALVRRDGTDVSVITYEAMLYKALEAAKQLATNGISVEVVDIRTINPLDKATIIASVKKTGKAVIVTEDHYSFGVSAELSATINEGAFEYLDGPIERIAPPDTPIPYSPPLEDAYLPQVDEIATGITKLAGY